MTFTNRQKMNIIDAKEACVRLLMERRTRGRFELLSAVTDLCTHAILVPRYEARKRLREATLAVGR